MSWSNLQAAGSFRMLVPISYIIQRHTPADHNLRSKMSHLNSVTPCTRVIIMAALKNMVFWVVMLHMLEKARHFRGTHCSLHLLGWMVSLLAICFLLVSCLAYSLTLKMETICSSETLGFFWTTWCYNPEDCTLHSQHSENLKSNTEVASFLTSSSFPD
jgi:hypothetical protein